MLWTKKGQKVIKIVFAVVSAVVVISMVFVGFAGL